jgi:hypothetical protein
MFKRSILKWLDTGHDEHCICPRPVCCRQRVVNAVQRYHVFGLLTWFAVQTCVACGDSGRHRPNKRW